MAGKVKTLHVFVCAYFVFSNSRTFPCTCILFSLGKGGKRGSNSRRLTKFNWASDYSLVYESNSGTHTLASVGQQNDSV